VSIQGAFLALFQIQAAAVARITGLVADVDRHDHVVVTIDCHRAVVSLNPATTAVEDVALGGGEVLWALGVGFPATLVGSVRCGIAWGSISAAGVVTKGANPEAIGISIASFWASSIRLRTPRARCAARFPALASPLASASAASCSALRSTGPASHPQTAARASESARVSLRCRSPVLLLVLAGGGWRINSQFRDEFLTIERFATVPEASCWQSSTGWSTAQTAFGAPGPYAPGDPPAVESGLTTPPALLGAGPRMGSTSILQLRHPRLLPGSPRCPQLLRTPRPHR
jgi:hypothetical protein